jgi:putative endonuclease
MPNTSEPKTFYVYMLASRPRGVLYVGLTSDLAARAWQHRERVREGFAKRYWVNRLVYFEKHNDAAAAARRERSMKPWRRDWKIQLIEKNNPTWRDLFGDVVRDDGFDW